MTDNRKVLQLLESLVDSGQSPEEICADCPELLGELNEQWEQCRRIDACIDALFGPADSAGPEPFDSARSGDGLPQIPGYQILAFQGRGGMGIVYRARHLELNRIIALKMLRSGAYASPVERARFLREARAIACLDHPNIVRVFDAGEFDRCPFFTMEFVQGKTLAEFLGGHPQPAASSVTMLLTLARATEYAHENRIIHRDLKPSNVLLTSDGTPRISDFGLARCLEGEEGLTLSGARLGTPSYMAPEQALGKPTVGPASDVYSLGAILYEMLTGRPPFLGESAADTERQLLAEDPVPPSRLNTRVPRDLQTICLKCLHKDPVRRYCSAQELSDDLARFQRGEPILARKVGMLERSIKWARRHPTIVTGVAGALLIGTLFLSAAVWWLAQRAATFKTVNEELQQAIGFQGNSSWAAADSALDRATYLLGNGGPFELRRRLEHARRDSQLVARLAEIRLAKCQTMTGDGEFAKTDTDYAAAFKEAGLGSDADPPAVVADRISHSIIRTALIDALDDWSTSVSTPRCNWIIEVVRLADPQDADPSSWRSQVRDTTPRLWFNVARLNMLMATADVEHQPVILMLGLVSRAVHVGIDPIPFLRRIEQAHPSDFWANFGLANQLCNRKTYTEAIRYYQGAIAARPDAALAHHNLGKTLATADRDGEAIPELVQAVTLNPRDPEFQSYLGVMFWRHQRFAEAIPLFEFALRAGPDDPISHFDLADCYVHFGRDAQAIEQYRLAIGLQPAISAAQNKLRMLAIQNQRADLLQNAWHWALKSNPPGYDPRDGYAELSLYVENGQEYRKECQDLLNDFGDAKDPRACASMGVACMLATESPSELKRAVALVERAVAADPSGDDPPTRLAHALSEYRQGQFQTASGLLQPDFPPALRPEARVILAMVQFRLGQVDAARKTLADAERGPDWAAAKALTRRQWIAQVLRREADQLIQSKS